MCAASRAVALVSDRARSAAGASVRAAVARGGLFSILLSTKILCMNLYCLITVVNKIIVFLK